MYIKTDEQNSIINGNYKFLIIKAFAGTGKTTTLVEFSLKNKDKNILYIAYNKETAEKARRIFPSNVTCRTAHSLAYSRFGYSLEKKLNKSTSLPFKPETIRKLFGFKRNEHSLKLSKELKLILENFCYSDYTKITDAIPFKKMSESRSSIELFINSLWNEMIDPDSVFPTTPDVYLKLYHLSRPKLNYDYILFDEAQDANPLISDLIMDQLNNNVKLVFVGDEHQSIYGFRGAINQIKNIVAEKELYLTKSFRFGYHISYAANAILFSLKNEKNKLIGFENIKDNLGDVDKNKQFAVISRTNSNLFLSSISALEKNYNIHFVGGFESYNFRKLLDLENLFLNKKDKIRDSFIRTFSNFEDYCSVANYTNDNEMLYCINIIKKYNGNLYDIISNIKKLSTTIDKADIILSTVHKSKGLEFKQVILSNDFPNFINKDGEIDFKISEDEVNILYVATTRAINILKPNKQLYNIIKYYEKNITLSDNLNTNTNNNNIFISNIENKFNFKE